MNDCGENKKFLLDYVDYYPIGQSKDVTFFYSLDENGDKDHVLDIQVENLVYYPVATYYKAAPATDTAAALLDGTDAATTSEKDAQISFTDTTKPAAAKKSTKKDSTKTVA